MLILCLRNVLSVCYKWFNCPTWNVSATVTVSRSNKSHRKCAQTVNTVIQGRTDRQTDTTPTAKSRSSIAERDKEEGWEKESRKKILTTCVTTVNCWVRLLGNESIINDGSTVLGGLSCTKKAGLSARVDGVVIVRTLKKVSHLQSWISTARCSQSFTLRYLAASLGWTQLCATH